MVGVAVVLLLCLDTSSRTGPEKTVTLTHLDPTKTAATLTPILGRFNLRARASGRTIRISGTGCRDDAAALVAALDDWLVEGFFPLEIASAMEHDSKTLRELTARVQEWRELLQMVDEILNEQKPRGPCPFPD